MNNEGGSQIWISLSFVEYCSAVFLDSTYAVKTLEKSKPAKAHFNAYQIQFHQRKGEERNCHDPRVKRRRNWGGGKLQPQPGISA